MPDPDPPVSSGHSETVRLPGVPGGEAAPAAWGKWQFPSPPELAAQLNGYEVECVLGWGGMGAVYRAKQLTLDRTVAIKLLPAELSGDPEFSKRFLREARSMAKLDHPNIVKVLEFGKTSAGHLYYSMDYVSGGDVRSLLQRLGPLPAPRAAALMHDVCAALECAHGSGIVHRDIKPANVLLTPDGRVKVADFGLSSMPGADSSATALTAGGMVMGTLDYMAPEYRQKGAISPALDIYAAGVMLYQILTGKLPAGAWALPSQVFKYSAETSRRLDAIVKKALQEDPAHRFADSGAMRQALEPLLPKSVPQQPSLRQWTMPAAALLLTAASWALTKTPWWNPLHARVNAASVSLAAPADPAAVEKVLLLDITQLRPVAADTPGKRKITPRDKLLALIRGIAAERPAAIGLDIDFSPASANPLEMYTPEDPEFFRALLKLKEETGVPVFAGVWRQDAAGSGLWLGNAEFAPLAAGLGIGIDDHEVITGIPVDLTAQKDGRALPSMSIALALAGGASAPAEPLLPSLMTRLSTTGTPKLTVREYIPDFSALDALVWQRAAGTNPDDIPGLRSRVRGNLILLSDSELKSGEASGEDRFFLPARPNAPVPGAFVHACGLVTLLSGAPGTLTIAGRIVAATLLLGFVAGGLAVTGTTRKNWRVSRLVVILAALAGAYVFMRLFRIAWPDLFYLASGLVLLHPLAALLDAAAGKMAMNKPEPRRVR